MWPREASALQLSNRTDSFTRRIVCGMMYFFMGETSMQSQLPGRLGDPNMTLLTDPRMDPRVASVIAATGDIGDAIEPVDENAPYQACVEYGTKLEALMSLPHAQMRAAMPDYSDVEQSTEVIQGVDGNEVTLYIHRPINQQGAMPCVFHTHGGGMVILTAEDPGYVRWRNDLAQSGLVVVGVEFRNGCGVLGNHPFPAGLNDCDSALQWTDQNRERLGISAIIMSGESGGGNLALATTLQAKRAGRIDSVQGVYALCPYISGAYADPPESLLSLKENDGYTLDGPMMSALVKAYDPDLSNAKNPLAWPYYASGEDLTGLPPHIISVNDLIRSEMRFVFFRNLLKAGNSAAARIVPATNHAGD